MLVSVSVANFESGFSRVGSTPISALLIHWILAAFISFEVYRPHFYLVSRLLISALCTNRTAHAVTRKVLHCVLLFRSASHSKGSFSSAYSTSSFSGLCFLLSNGLCGTWKTRLPVGCSGAFSTMPWSSCSRIIFSYSNFYFSFLLSFCSTFWKRFLLGISFVLNSSAPVTHGTPTSSYLPSLPFAMFS